MKPESRFMQEAVKEADIGIAGAEGGPFGCVIVKNGTIVGRGHNMVLKKKDPTCHGEMMAIRDAAANLDSYDLKDCELYTTGQPCPMCFGAIQWANIKKVYYGCSLSDAESIGFRDVEFYQDDAGRSSICTQIEGEICKALFERYQNRQDRILY